MPIYTIAEYRVRKLGVEKVKQAIAEFVPYVQAQEPGTRIRVQIPFDFTVKGKTLPAGEYDITRVMDEPVTLLLRNVGEKHNEAIVETEPVLGRNRTNRDELIFNRYGDTYFLSDIFTAGEQTGEELRTTHKERELKREMARNQAGPETVTIAALN